MIIPFPPATSQTATQLASYILHERAQRFYGAGVGYLSIKSFFGGYTAHEEFGLPPRANDRGQKIEDRG